MTVASAAVVLAPLCGCRSAASRNAELPYVDVTQSHLPAADLEGLSMDAMPVDVDRDGDLDIMIASEFQPNILLINDGAGRFTNESARRIPQARHDSEDVGVADFDGDGDPDIVVVSEDDQVNELYLNDGGGFFSDAGAKLPVTGVTNAVLVADIDRDGDADILFGNNGQNFVIVNDGRANFTDETGTRLPPIDDITQDIELGDVDGDGDGDLLVGNEGANRLLLNEGTGRFADATHDRLPLRAEPEETREADFGDVDGDGDLDIFFANVRFFQRGALRENRLLINDGRGYFTDETGSRLPQHGDNTVDGDFVDVDRDGDLDIVTANVGSLRPRGRRPYRALINDGDGVFVDGTASVFPESVTGLGFDAEAADLDGDGRTDFFFSSRRGVDRLVLLRAE
ncbi:MAG: FG-GAP repeat domain-containing protein [Alphaproteobacteria bacterium]